MFGTVRKSVFTVLAMALLVAPAFAADAPASVAKPEAGATKKVVFLAGGASHGFGSHDHKAGCHLLAERINKVPGFEAVVYYKAWPKPEAFEGASAVVMYCDGGGGHMGLGHLDQLQALNDKGVGIGCIHYAVEVPKDKGGPQWLDWMGGYFETFLSVNPHWTANFDKLPDHPVARGVKPFGTNDEWYYHMRFRNDMNGVTPVLTAVPPDSTRKGKDDAHGGNPTVRAEIGKNTPEHVVWVSENKNGTRGFGCTGGHFHRNWANDDFRKTILNAIVWTAKGEVPQNGVESKRPDLEEMLANHDETPKDDQKQRLAKEIEEANKPREPKDAGKAARASELLYDVSASAR